MNNSSLIDNGSSQMAASWMTPSWMVASWMATSWMAASDPSLCKTPLRETGCFGNPYFTY